MNNRKGIKLEARSFLSEEKRWLKMFITLLPVLAVTQGYDVASGIKSGFKLAFIYHFDAEQLMQQSNAGTVISNISSDISAILSLLFIPFSVAMAGYFLECLRNRNDVGFEMPYKEGYKRYGKYIEVGIVTSIVISLWSLLLIIPGIIKAYEYSQVEFITHDNPKLSSKECRVISSRMTKGYKGDLFALSLSFIPWYLFVMVTCGIGVIYVEPYVRTVKAMYYENLKAFALQNGTVHPMDFGMVPVVPENQEEYVAPQPVSYEYNPEHVDFVESNYEDENITYDNKED